MSRVLLDRFSQFALSSEDKTTEGTTIPPTTTKTAKAAVSLGCYCCFAKRRLRLALRKTLTSINYDDYDRGALGVVSVSPIYCFKITISDARHSISIKHYELMSCITAF